MAERAMGAGGERARALEMLGQWWTAWFPAQVMPTEALIDLAAALASSERSPQLQEVWLVIRDGQVKDAHADEPSALESLAARGGTTRGYFIEHWMVMRSPRGGPSGVQGAGA